MMHADDMMQEAKPEQSAGGDFLSRVSVLMLTYNEVENLGRTLAALARFSDIVVLDSGSTDDTVKIAESFPNVRIYTRQFDNHAAQWTYGLTQCGIVREWVLALDADYLLSSSLVDEIARIAPDTHYSAFLAKFRYLVYGQPLSATLYPPVNVLYKRAKGTYVQSGHTQRLVVDDPVGELSNRIDHDDRKPLARWLGSQQKYAKLEGEHLLKTPSSELRRIDRLRRLAWPAPILVFFYTLLIKRCIFNGWPGWFYVLQRTLAEIMIALEIVYRRVNPEASKKR